MYLPTPIFAKKLNMHPIVNEAIFERRSRLLEHPLYLEMEDPVTLRIFLEHHVFAVWDFMSLLKALQIRLTCSNTPWVPVGNPEIRYLINEIVLAEETDINKFGKRQSHFEMYLDAMTSCGASTREITSFLDLVKTGTDIFKCIAHSRLPQSVKQFLLFTFSIIEEGKPHKIAAAFTYGREDLIPDLFNAILKNMEHNFPSMDLGELIYYFERHIELDGDEHGPMALQMISELCEGDPEKWNEVVHTASEALDKRLALWDGIHQYILKEKSEGFLRV